MDLNGKVYPNCPNAANPYHECGAYCLDKITEGKGRKEKKNIGSKFLDVSRSFGRKKKGSDSQPLSPQMLENVRAAKSIYPADPRSPYSRENVHAAKSIYPADPRSPRSHFSRKKMEENGGSYSSSEQHSGEVDSRDQTLDNGQVHFAQLVPVSGRIAVTALLGLDDDHESEAISERIKSARETPTKLKEEKTNPSLKVASNANVEEKREGSNGLNFSFSAAVTQAPEDSDDDEIQSVISDSCVSVGKYHVKESVSTTLQSILDTYGDIAADCRLESTSMLAYYLECLCAVVQELQVTPFKQLTKSKIREMFSVLKDVESARINVGWLRDILNEISEAIEFIGQNQSMEAAKANFDRTLESTRREVQSQMEELAQKEKEAADARERVAETKARLSQLELECSQLEKTISSLRSLVKKSDGKSVTDELL